MISAAALHLFFLTGGNPDVDSGSGLSILNKGNARLSALDSKIVECMELYQSSTDDALRMEKVVDLGMVAICFEENEENQQWEGESLKLRDSRVGAASKWSVISDEQKTQDILQEAFKYISDGDGAAGMSNISDGDGAAGTGAAFNCYFKAVIDWWKGVLNWDSAKIASWIKRHDWDGISDVWMGDNESGHNNVSDLVDAQMAESTEDGEKKGFLLSFVLMNFARLSKIACIAPDGLHRLLAAFNLLHKYLKEKGYLLKLADRALQFEVKLLLQQQDETIYGYFEKCKEASYKADSLTKKLPLSTLNAMFDLIVKIEDNLGDTWLGYVDLLEKFVTFLGSRQYNQLLDEYAQRASCTEEEKAALKTFKSELDGKVSDGSFSLYAELRYDVSLGQSEFEEFFQTLLVQASMPRTLIENLQSHFDWKRMQLQQGEDLPPTKITAFELTDALHQLWTYHLLVTLYQQLSNLNVTAIILLGLPFNEEEFRFGLTQEEFLCLFTTVNSGKLTTLPGLSGSRTQNKWQSETLAHLDRSLGGKGHSRRREDELDLSLSSKALNAITLCLASFLNNEVSKRFKLFLSTTASCQDEAMQTLQCMYAYFGTYLIQFELVSGARDAHYRSVALIKWASRDVISMAFAVNIFDAALKHVTVAEFVSQNESVENRFKNESDPHFSVNLCFGTAKRIFQANGPGSAIFVATCQHLKAALSLVFQTTRRNASCKELARELWGVDWGFDFSSQQPVGTIMMYDAIEPGVSTNLNVGLGFSGLGGCIGFAHLSLSADALVLSELVGVNVDGQSLNNATEEDDDEEGRASGDDNESVPVQREERNSLEEESTSPPQGKSLDLLKTTSTKRPQNHSNAASDAAGKRKRSGKELALLQQEDKNSTESGGSGRKSRKKSGTKSTSGRGHSKNDTEFLLDLLGYLYVQKELGDKALEDAVRKCGSDPANYDPAEHYQRYQAWMWSNLEHLDLGLPRSDTASDIFDRGNRNGNGNVCQQEGREELNTRAFFGTAAAAAAAAQPVAALAVKCGAWEQEQNTEPAAKGKEKAQRMAGKQPTWNDEDEILREELLDCDKVVDSENGNGNGKHPSLGHIGGEGKNITLGPDDIAALDALETGSQGSFTDLFPESWDTGDNV